MHIDAGHARHVLPILIARKIISREELIDMFGNYSLNLRHGCPESFETIVSSNNRVAFSYSEKDEKHWLNCYIALKKQA